MPVANEEEPKRSQAGTNEDSVRSVWIQSNRGSNGEQYKETYRVEKRFTQIL